MFGLFKRQRGPETVEYLLTRSMDERCVWVLESGVRAYDGLASLRQEPETGDPERNAQLALIALISAGFLSV